MSLINGKMSRRRSIQNGSHGIQLKKPCWAFIALDHSWFKDFLFPVLSDSCLFLYWQKGDRKKIWLLHCDIKIDFFFTFPTITSVDVLNNITVRLSVATCGEETSLSVQDDTYFNSALIFTMFSSSCFHNTEIYHGSLNNWNGTITVHRDILLAWNAYAVKLNGIMFSSYPAPTSNKQLHCLEVV